MTNETETPGLFKGKPRKATSLTDLQQPDYSQLVRLFKHALFIETQVLNPKPKTPKP